MNTNRSLLILGGFSSLIIAMGVGRFAYTPLLPEMQAKFKFSNDIAGAIASINYLGYFIGALLCYKRFSMIVKLWIFRFLLVTCVVTTLAMGIVSQVQYWMIIRFLGGVASAGVFIFGSSFVMEMTTQKSKYSSLSILIYSGVGMGIALSGVISPVLVKNFGVQFTWIGLSFLCIPLGLLTWFTVIPDTKQKLVQPIILKTEQFKYPKILPWLVIAYFCEGFGYIVSGTFLVSFLKNQSSLYSSGNFAWTIVGITASISVPLFYQLSKRINPVYILIAAHILQGIGILMPIFSSHWIAVNVGAILFGATFMGITALTLYIGKLIKPMQSNVVIGMLTAVYGVGQILGPAISGVLSQTSQSFTSSLVMSAVIVWIGGVLLIAGVYQNRPKYFFQPIIRRL